MGKVQQSNREKRKPKTVKPKAAVQATAFSTAHGNTKGAPVKKGK
jgi:hypothetical protein